MLDIFDAEVCDQAQNLPELLESLALRLAERLPVRRLLLTSLDERRRLLYAAIHKPKKSRGVGPAKIEHGILSFRGPILPRLHQPINARLIPLFEAVHDFTTVRGSRLTERPELATYPRTAREFYRQLEHFAELGYRYSIALLWRSEICGFLFLGPDIASDGREADRLGPLLRTVKAMRRPLALLLRDFADHRALLQWRRESERQVDRLTDALVRRPKAIMSEGEPGKGFVVAGRRMRLAVDQLAEWAHLEYPVLVQGETGTGKELAARFVHEESPRSKRPFIAVNCATIPETLWEAQVFGYGKGAFTDAKRAHRGFIEQAADGTLFFDEIGEMPPAMQSRLLRVIQERSYQVIGQERSRRVRCRFLFATNRDLEREIESGRFRKDLFYRIAVLHCSLPPLRKRREELPALAEFFMNNLAESLASPARKLSDEILELFRGYRWPGNVRELQNIILRAMLSAEGESLESRHLGPLDKRRIESDRVESRRRLNSRPADSQADWFRTQKPLIESLAGSPEDTVDYTQAVNEYRRRLLIAALQASGGNKRAAARSLGLSPQTLDYQIRSLGLQYRSEVRRLEAGREGP